MDYHVGPCSGERGRTLIKAMFNGRCVLCRDHGVDQDCELKNTRSSKCLSLCVLEGFHRRWPRSPLLSETVLDRDYEQFLKKPANFR
jgi:hypothetical protein